MTGDSFFTLTPAARRAFNIGIEALRARGHTLVEISDAKLFEWARLYYS